jgi:hypothetical protein
MSEIPIHQTIPDVWAKQGQCPCCAASEMRVQHPSGGADRLQCIACGLTFELELSGDRLHVVHWPDALPFLHLMVPDEWMTPAKLRALIQQATSPTSTDPPTPPAVLVQPPLRDTPSQAMPDTEKPDSVVDTVIPPTTPHESTPPALDPNGIAIRINRLRALGNSSREIRTILTQGEKQPDRIQAILKIIAQDEQQERSRQSKKLGLSLGIFVGLAILLLGAGYVFWKSYQNKPASATGTAAQGTQAPNTAAPNAVIKALNLNTPVVKYNPTPPGSSTGDASVCPRTSGQAAGLFGGQPSDWSSPSGSNGWIMVRKGKSADIFIPKGMKAAYLQLDNSLQLVDVDGPVTLSGAYYVAVSCP